MSIPLRLRSKKSLPSIPLLRSYCSLLGNKHRPFPVLLVLLDHIGAKPLQRLLLHLTGPATAPKPCGLGKKASLLTQGHTYPFRHTPVFAEVLCPKSIHLPDVKQQYSLWCRIHCGSNRFHCINNHPKSYWLKTTRNVYYLSHFL